MPSLTTRRGKGGPLTHDELDDNFEYLLQLIQSGGVSSSIQTAIDTAIENDNVRDDETYERQDQIISDLPPLP